jgi:protein TonB
MQGLLLKRVNPNYPEDARQARIQGSVLLKVVISREGNVAEMHVPSGHPLLVPAAVDAVKRWEYRPYILNGNPVEIDSQIRANFTLGG